MTELAGGENASFDGTGTFEAPAIFGDGLSETELQRAYGSERLADAGAVLVEGFVLAGGEKADLASEAVT